MRVVSLCPQNMALYLDRIWHVGLVRAPIASFLEADFRPAIDWLPRPAFSDFLADPFGVMDQGTLTVFAEAYDHGTRRGRIVCTRLVGCEWTPPEPAFVPAHHVSFPYLARVDDGWLCVPEQWQTGELTIHELDLVQGRIKGVVARVATLQAVDPILFRHRDRYWVLATDRQTGHLHAFSAASWTGPYTAHPHNPVQRDALARNAGTPFEANGKLFRPAMCNRRRYGHAIELREVELSDATYTERSVRRMEPWDRTYALGVHTLASAGDVTLVDGLRPSWTPGSLRALSARLRAPAY